MMSWSKKITILYLSFVGLILTLVILSFGHKVELESKDYYAQELKFQDKINAISNEKNSSSTIKHVLQKNELILNADTSITNHNFSGKIVFFRPSDSSKDLSFDLKFIDNTQIINTSVLIKGVYKIQLSWASNNKTFFKEEVIFIN